MNTISIIRSFAMLLVVAILSGCATVGGGYSSQVWIPAKDGAEDIKLEATLYLPSGKGPFPVLVFNHGSASPDVPNKVTTPYREVAGVFIQEGYAVIVPMRRGRGASGGKPHDRSTCDRNLSIEGLDHGLEDIDAVMRYVRQNPTFDSSSILIGGQSRGGLLAVAYAAKHPQNIKGVINFVGGWMAHWRCTFYAEEIFREAGAKIKVPTVFIYAKNDRLNSLPATELYRSAFAEEGAKFLTFKLYEGGHDLVIFPRIWESSISTFR